MTNPGVQLLIARMESNPEEFCERDFQYANRTYDKWDVFINNIYHRIETMDQDAGLQGRGDTALVPRRSKALPFLSDEEVTLLFDKLMEAQRRMFEQRVMATLLGDNRAAYADVGVNAGSYAVGRPTPAFTKLKI